MCYSHVAMDFHHSLKNEEAAYSILFVFNLTWNVFSFFSL